MINESEFYTAANASIVTGCTLRQLQYWRIQSIVLPIVDAKGTGHSVYYSVKNLRELVIFKELLDHGLNFRFAQRCLNLLRVLNPNFNEVHCTTRYYFTSDRHQNIWLHSNKQEQLDYVLNGQPSYPLWLDRIYSKLTAAINGHQTKQ